DLPDRRRRSGSRDVGSREFEKLSTLCADPEVATLVEVEAVRETPCPQPYGERGVHSRRADLQLLVVERQQLGVTPDAHPQPVWGWRWRWRGWRRRRDRARRDCQQEYEQGEDGTWEPHGYLQGSTLSEH